MSKGKDNRGDPRKQKGEMSGQLEQSTKGCGCSIITILVLLPIVIVALLVIFR